MKSLILATFVKALAVVSKFYPVEKGQGRVVQWPLVRRACQVLPEELVVKTRRGTAIKVAPSDYLGRRLFLFGEHEPRNIRVLLKPVEGKKMFWDIGANYGLFSLELKKAYPSLKIVAVEPQPRLQAMFRESIALNGFSDIELNECALGTTPGTVVLNIPERSLAVASTKTISGKSSKVSVRLSTLDEMLNNFGPPDVIKLDIEGAEPDAIAGGTQLFSRHKPAILLEVNSAQRQPVRSDVAVAQLLALGYSIHTFRGEALSPCNLDKPLLSGHDIVAIRA